MNSSPTANAVPSRLPVRRLLGCLLILAASCATCCAFALFFVGRWLVVEDPLQKSAAIVVLSGRMPRRAREAAQLYREGWAPEVWITRAKGPQEELDEMGIAYVGEDFYTAKVLMHLGVPADAMRRLQPEIDNTASEMDVIAKYLAEAGSATVILVTSKPHTRRVRRLWKQRVGPSGTAIVRAAREDPFDPRHWWRTTGDALDVVREVLGLANSYAGLPIRPAG